MPTCSKCKKLKNRKFFSICNGNKNGLQNICKLCTKIYDKTRLEYKKVYNKNFRKRNLDYIYKYLSSKKCIDCGESNLLVLEFDHLYEKKDNIISMSNKKSLDDIKDEIKKCEVVCANCHRIRTAKRNNSYRLEFYNGD